MKSVSISGSPRVNVGKKDAKEIRRQGDVPCVLYGGKEQVFFSASEKVFKSIVYTPEALVIKLDIGGKQFDAITQEIQFHKISDKIIHIDFLEVIPGKSIVMNIPVKVEGNSVGVKAGGKLNKKLRSLKVRGLVEKMPEHILLNVESLGIGQSIKVGDVKVEGLELLDAPNVTVVTISMTRAVAATEEAKPAATKTAAKAATPAAAPAKKADAKK